jgi:hypothetical protein
MFVTWPFPGEVRERACMRAVPGSHRLQGTDIAAGNPANFAGLMETNA